MPENLDVTETLSVLDNIDIQQLIETYVLPWGINIVMALVIFLIGKLIVKVLVQFAKKVMVKAKVDNILVNFIGSIINAILLLFVVIAALDQLGVETTSLIALIGAAGLAVGLALQGTLQNLASALCLSSSVHLMMVILSTRRVFPAPLKRLEYLLPPCAPVIIAKSLFLMVKFLVALSLTIQNAAHVVSIWFLVSVTTMILKKPKRLSVKFSMRMNAS